MYGWTGHSYIECHKYGIGSKPKTDANPPGDRSIDEQRHACSVQKTSTLLLHSTYVATNNRISYLLRS